MTPEARARAVYELIKADPFGDSPLKAIADAIAAAERAAYRRARQVALDYWTERIADHGCPSSAGNAVMNVADAILALDKPKEPT